MTLQNEHILLEEAHRRVAQKLRDAELERVGRRPRRLAAGAVMGVVGLAGLAAGVWVFVIGF